MMLSSRPVPPSVHLTPAQRAVLLQQTSPTLTATPLAAMPANSQLPATGVLAGRSPSGRILPKRDTSKVIAAQPVRQSLEQPAPQSQPQPSVHTNGALQHGADNNSVHTEAALVHEPVASAQSDAANERSTPTKLIPSSSSATVSPASSNPQSPSLRPLLQPYHTSVQQPDPVLSSSRRVAAHQQPLLDALYELVHAAGVGHWQGLTGQQRKDIATQLCREHLFNPQPGNSKDSRTIVQWQAQGSWTEYDVWVTCVRTVSPYYQGDMFITTYTAHFDQVGRLVEFDEKETRAKKNCVIQ